MNTTNFGSVEIRAFTDCRAVNPDEHARMYYVQCTSACSKMGVVLDFVLHMFLFGRTILVLCWVLRAFLIAHAQFRYLGN